MTTAKGSIKQRSKNSLTIIASTGQRDPETGRYKQKWQTVKRNPGETDKQLHARAERELRKLLTKLDEGEPVPTGRLTFYDFVHRTWLPAVRLHVSERTAQGYEDIMNRHVLPALGSKQLRSITPAHIEHIYSKMAANGLSGNTRLHVHRVIAMALTDAVRRGKIPSNPASRERMRAPSRNDPTPGKEHFSIQPPSPEEVARLIESASETRIGVLVKLLAYTGLRIGEALGLRWQDVDLDAGLLQVRQVRKQREQSVFGRPKTDCSRRTVDIAPELVAALREYQREQFATYLENVFVDPQNLVFTTVTRNGMEGMGHDYVSRLWKVIRVRANVPRVRIHDLRHFAATTMIAAKVPLPEVSAILGHTQTSTTANTYAHTIPGRGAAAVAEIEKVLAGK